MAAKMRICPLLRDTCIREECAAWDDWRINPGGGFSQQFGCALLKRTAEELTLEDKKGKK